MLHVLGKAVTYFLGDSDDEEETDGSDAGLGVSVDSPASIQQGHTHVTTPPSHEEHLKLRSENQPKFKEINGEVTGTYSGYGLIDENIYFEYDCVLGGTRPRVGDHVTVKAAQEKNTQSWKAVKVSIHVDWEGRTNSGTQSQLTHFVKSDKILEHSTMETAVGMVTKTAKDCGTINEDIPYSTSYAVEGFLPYKGDWVTCEVYTDNNTHTTEARNIHPLRQWEYEGEITDTKLGHGYINNSIYFSYINCINGYRPRRGDVVSGVAIESQQANVNWRAMNVLCRPVVDLRPNQRIFQNLQKHSPANRNFILELFGSKNGIKVTESLDFGVLTLGEQKTLTCWIKNDGPMPCCIIGCSVKDTTNKQFSIDDPQSLIGYGGNKTMSQIGDKINIYPGMAAFVKIHCNAGNPGKDKQLLVIEFKGFKIGRYVSVEVNDPYSRLMTPSTPYQRRKNFCQYRTTNEMDETWVVTGQRPLFSNRTPVALPNRLPKYPVPNNMRSCVVDRQDPISINSSLGQELTINNYIERFKSLLHLEEIQEEINIRQYDLHNVMLRQCGPFLGLTVPGILDGLPNINIGDKVLLTHSHEMFSGPQYEAYVHEVHGEELMLKFSLDFHESYADEEYDVIFSFSRTPFRRCHQAINFGVKLGKTVLFPMILEPKLPQHKAVVNQCSKSSKKDSCKSSKFYNASLNSRQRSAVQRILDGISRPSPYILFGPPGTGKTVTVVEAILQIFTHLASSRILACTPSNSASDLIAERLIDSGQISKSDLVRLNAFRRVEENIPEKILPYCSVGDDLRLVARHRLVICTCTSAGMLYTLGLDPGHFTHAFIDEAGQATEPECLIPIGLVACSGGQTVLAGDPMQLGPVLMSKYAKVYGLQQSLLERLINTSLYERDERKFSGHGCYDPLLVTKLVNNYRSHEALIQLSSELFYDNELLECAKESLTHCLCGWDLLPNPDVPLIFHGMRGEDMRESNCPSWFNPIEAIQVMKYLKAVVSNTIHPFTFDDIGIITPYRKQVEKIRQLIAGLGMDKVKVGSVEEFQGQERPVMIVSTVRSNESLLDYDMNHNLGFISNPKRFNVTITRAQALLVVIGNPHLLVKDEYWRSLLEYSIKRKAYTGCGLPDDIIKHTGNEPSGNVPSGDVPTGDMPTDDVPSGDITETSMVLDHKHEHNIVAEKTVGLTADYTGAMNKGGGDASSAKDIDTVRCDGVTYHTAGNVTEYYGATRKYTDDDDHFDSKLKQPIDVVHGVIEARSWKINKLVSDGNESEDSMPHLEEITSDSDDSGKVTSSSQPLKLVASVPPHT